MKKNNPRTIEKAINYAFLLLKFRPRSKYEISSRLKRKKIDQEVVDKVLNFLEEKKFIDDRYFAKAWLAYRLKANFGLKKVKLELNQKGIAKELINELVDGQSKDYPEKTIIEELVKKRMKRLKGIEPKKKRDRLYGYLLRRGFSQENIIEVINNL